MGRNEGISISGGSVQAGAMAAGTHATATNVTATPATETLEDLRVRMAELLRSVREQAPSLPDGASSVTVAEVATRELEKEQPNKHSFLGLMQSLAAGVGSVASLAGAVSSIQESAAALF
jgi:hypothetical protein